MVKVLRLTGMMGRGSPPTDVLVFALELVIVLVGAGGILKPSIFDKTKPKTQTISMSHGFGAMVLDPRWRGIGWDIG
jgi:hypothetical protein